MSYVIPAMNTLWFYFTDEKHRRLMHGTPADCMRKFKVLEEMRVLSQGLEIFLSPSKLKDVNEFETWFFTKFSKLKYRTVHIGEAEKDFLLNSEAMYDKMKILFEILNHLEVEVIILHAHHLFNERHKIKEFLDFVLPNTRICVENNGFDNEWGHSIEGLKEIFDDCPEYDLCLDIAHIKDVKKFALEKIVSVECLRSRIRQIHFSYSTRFASENLYAKQGYHGYEPLHGLWSVIGISPSKRTKEFIRKFPVILEGIVPREDVYLDFLKQEIELLN